MPRGSTRSKKAYTPVSAANIGGGIGVSAAHVLTIPGSVFPTAGAAVCGLSLVAAAVTSGLRGGTGALPAINAFGARAPEKFVFQLGAAVSAFLFLATAACIFLHRRVALSSRDLVLFGLVRLRTLNTLSFCAHAAACALLLVISVVSVKDEFVLHQALVALLFPLVLANQAVGAAHAFAVNRDNFEATRADVALFRRRLLLTAASGISYFFLPILYLIAPGRGWYARDDPRDASSVAAGAGDASSAPHSESESGAGGGASSGEKAAEGGDAAGGDDSDAGSNSGSDSGGDDSAGEGHASGNGEGIGKSSKDSILSAARIAGSRETLGATMVQAAQPPAVAGHALLSGAAVLASRAQAAILHASAASASPLPSLAAAADSAAGAAAAAAAASAPSAAGDGGGVGFIASVNQYVLVTLIIMYTLTYRRELSGFVVSFASDLAPATDHGLSLDLSSRAGSSLDPGSRRGSNAQDGDAMLRPRAGTGAEVFFLAGDEDDEEEALRGVMMDPNGAMHEHDIFDDDEEAAAAAIAAATAGRD